MIYYILTKILKTNDSNCIASKHYGIFISHRDMEHIVCGNIQSVTSIYESLFSILPVINIEYFTNKHSKSNMTKAKEADPT